MGNRIRFLAWLAGSAVALTAVAATAGWLPWSLALTLDLLLAMTGAGMLLLRRLVWPLLVRLLRAKQLARKQASDANEHLAWIQSEVESASDGIIVLERDGSIVGWNAGATRVFGYAAQEVLGRNFSMLIPESMRPAFIEGISCLALTGRSGFVGKGLVVFPGRHKSGRVFEHEFAVNEMKAGGNGNLVMVSRDISERRSLEQALRQSENRLRMVTDNMPALIGYIDSDHIWRFNNKAYEIWFDKSSAELTGCHMLEVLGAERYERVLPHLRRALGGERVTFENEFDRVDGLHQVESIFIPDGDEEGRVRGVYAMTYDITRQKAVEAQLTRLARFDTLTGLANRSHFNEHLLQAHGRSRREGKSLALMYLDIDKFKQVNDAFGHDIGDGLLKVFAARIGSAVRETDFVSRLGGDEFTVILEGLKDEEDAAVVGGKIIAAMADPVMLVGHLLCITTSIGIAVSRGARETPEELLKRADSALYASKAAGRNNYRFAPPPAALA